VHNEIWGTVAPNAPRGCGPDLLAFCDHMTSARKRPSKSAPGRRT